MKKCLLVLSGIVMTAGMLFAQPANDMCSGAISLTVYDTEAEAVRVDGDTRNTVDGSLDGIPVCSGNFYRDDVWYSITAPSEPNEAGYAVKVYYAELPDDVDSFGMAVYTSCDAVASNIAIFCGNSPRNDQAVVCLSPDQTVYIRVWSNIGGAANWQEGWGTFRIAAFKATFDGTTDVTVLWGDEPGQGDFDGGLNDWTLEGLQCNGTPPENALWAWTSSGFPAYTFGPYGGIEAIKSRTVCNGSMIFDSGFLDLGETGVGGSGPCPWDPHEGALISPVIDLSGFDVAGVSLLFNQSMQKFSGGQHFVDVSFDGGATWSEIEINADKDFLSTNPATGQGYHNEEFRLRLPGAEGQANLRLRFRFLGVAYWWVIDDVRIIETEAHNLRIDNLFVSYHLPMQTVAGQGLPWFPQVDIINVGALTQENVTLNATIADGGGNIIYDQTRNLGQLQPDSSFVNLESTINVPANIADIGPGMYSVTYTVSYDSAGVDFNPADNVVTYQAFVDPHNFALEQGANGTVVGAPGNWNDGVPHSFIFGNYFHTPAGSIRKFVSGAFGLANLDEVAGVEISFVLFKWNTGLEDDACQANERTLLGFASYTPSIGDGGADGDTIITLEFENLISTGPIVLEDNGSYILAIQWDSPGDDGDLVVLTSDAVDYGQVIQQYGDLGTPHFGGLLAVPDDGINDGIDIGTFTYGNDPLSARSIVPVVRMNTDFLISVNDPLPVNNLITVYPNPTQDYINLELEMERVFDRVDVQIVTLHGQVISSKTLFNVQQETTTIDVSSLPTGTYLAHVQTELGRRYKVFVVQR